jgi:hypothetical protein
MKVGLKALTTFMALALASMPVSNAVAQTTVALHATQEEVNIWKQRAVNGPYKDGYDRILANANAFVSSPGAVWLGKREDGCWLPFTHERPGRTRDVGLRDAGFIYMLTGNTTYRNAVRTKLLAQAAVSGTDLSNTARWCASSSWFDVSNWFRRILFGYSYVRSSLSAGDIATLDSYFLKAAQYFEYHMNNVIRGRFPNRLRDDYTCSGATCPGTVYGLQYFGGPTSYQFMEAWNNQASARMALVADVGVLLNNTTLKDRAARYVREFVRYAMWPDGSVVEKFRWSVNNLVSHAYSYPLTNVGDVLSIADHLARSGDTSLYEYSTSEGMFGTQGGPKSLLKALKHIAGQTNGSIIHYASTSPTSDPAKIIDATTNCNSISYVYIANNNFYKDAHIKATYSRALPSGSWCSGGYEERSGSWGTYPDTRFMFGQMEDKVSPYTGGVTTLPLAAPSNLEIVVVE